MPDTPPDTPDLKPETWCVEAEWHQPTDILVQSPRSIATTLGAQAPAPNLFFPGYNHTEAGTQHDAFSDILEEYAQVHSLTDLMTPAIDSLLEAYVDINTSAVADEDEMYQEIRNNLMDTPSLAAEAILSRADITLTPPEEEADIGEAARNLGVRYNIQDPLSNIFFLRDQTFWTDQGCVTCTMQSTTRQPEPELIATVLDQNGMDTFYTIDAGGIEGGDFFAAGDYALIGISPRTDYAAAQQVLEKNAVGFPEVGLVSYSTDITLPGGSAETQMDIMHLDTWFNYAEEDTVVWRGPVANHEETIVEIYEKTDNRYTQMQEQDFETYLDENGVEAIDADAVMDDAGIGETWYRSMATNFLNVGDSTVVASYIPDEDGEYDEELNPLLTEMERYEITVEPVNLSEVAKSAGSAHCLTAVPNRSQ